jgi:DNA polymerase-1
VNDLEVVASAIREIGGPVSLDIETCPPRDALDPYKGEIRLLTLAVGEHSPWLLDLKSIGYELGPLKSVLETSEVLGHNLGFDALWLRLKCGVALKKVFCTMTASRLLAAGSDAANDLGQCLSRHLQLDLPKDQGRSDWGAAVLTPEQLHYAADDVVHLWKLKCALLAEIGKHGLEKVCALEQSLLPVVVEMEARGIAVDPEKLTSIREQAERELQDATTAVQQFVGDADFNPNSTAQVLEKFRGRGVHLPNTQEETLVACQDPLAQEILKYRVSKKLAEQAQSLLNAVGADGRIHASFNPMGTRTGRFSSSKPNLQNVGRGLRSCFVPRPGNVLVVADYSQIELRGAAATADEEMMLTAYKEGADLHRQTASLVLRKPLEEVLKEHRQLAKAVNFGLLYGQSARGLVRFAKTSYGVDLTESDAEAFRNRFFEAYPGLKRWHNENWQRAKNGATEVRTVTGRRRLLPSGPTKEWQRFTGLVNTVVQGGCADGLKYAMVNLAQRLPEGAHIVSTIHDELIVEAPQELAEEVKALVCQSMVEAMELLFPQVPIEVEAKVVANWGEK